MVHKGDNLDRTSLAAYLAVLVVHFIFCLLNGEICRMRLPFIIRMARQIDLGVSIYYLFCLSSVWLLGLS